MGHKILIIERGDGDGKIYSYFEDAEHFITVTHRGDADGRDMSKWVSPDEFNNECDVARSLQPGQWTSIIVK